MGKITTFNNMLISFLPTSFSFLNAIGNGEKPNSLHCYVTYCCSVTQSCMTLCDLRDCSTPGFSVHHQLLEFTQIHAHFVGDAIQPSHPPSSPSPPTFNPSQHQGLFQLVSSLHEVAKVLELQLQHQSFQQLLLNSY